MALFSKARAEGFALIEAILFMVIVGVAAGAMLSLFAGNSQRSADALVERQAADVAEAILAEVKATPFTSAESLTPGGREGAEQRFGPQRFNHISDYHNAVIGPGIRDTYGLAVPGLEAFTAVVTVQRVAAANMWNSVLPSSEVALVTVSVTHPTLRAPVLLQGLKTRHDIS